MSVRDAKEIGAIVAERQRQARARGVRAPAYGQTYLAARIAIRLEDLREQQGLTMQQLAERVGTSRAHVSRLLSGRYVGITLSTLTRLARALGCEVDIRFRPIRARRTPRHTASRTRRRAAVAG